MHNYYSWKGNDLYLNIYLRPSAKKNTFAGLFDNKLKIFLTSPPTKGKANKHLIEFIAENFNLPKKYITIIKGEVSPEKILKIEKPNQILIKKILATLEEVS